MLILSPPRRGEFSYSSNSAAIFRTSRGPFRVVLIFIFPASTPPLTQEGIAVIFKFPDRLHLNPDTGTDVLYLAKVKFGCQKSRLVVLWRQWLTVKCDVVRTILQ